MTTVAYKSGVLAFDSKVSAGERHSGFITKGIKTNRFIVAACGSAEDMAAFLDWMKSGAAQDDRKKFGLEREVEIAALAINRKGTVFHYECRLYPYIIDAPFHAIGSGADFALGAMAFGASSAKAVRIAAKFDAFTGGAVRELSW